MGGDAAIWLAHSNGEAHMSQICFPDGNDLELLAPQGDEDPPRWKQFIQREGGLCAWAVTVDDIDTVAAQVRMLALNWMDRSQLVANS